MSKHSVQIGRKEQEWRTISICPRRAGLRACTYAPKRVPGTCSAAYPVSLFDLRASLARLQLILCTDQTMQWWQSSTFTWTMLLGTTGMRGWKSCLPGRAHTPSTWLYIIPTPLFLFRSNQMVAVTEQAPGEMKNKPRYYCSNINLFCTLLFQQTSTRVAICIDITSRRGGTSTAAWRASVDLSSWEMRSWFHSLLSYFAFCRLGNARNHTRESDQLPGHMHSSDRWWDSREGCARAGRKVWLCQFQIWQPLSWLRVQLKAYWRIMA